MNQFGRVAAATWPNWFTTMLLTIILINKTLAKHKNKLPDDGLLNRNI